MQALSNKTKQFLLVSMKILILASVLMLIISRFTKDDGSVNKLMQSKILLSSLYLNIPILLLLSLFNWSIEALKWKALVRHCTSISIKESYKQVLASHTTSLITPAKMGEYGAKALFYPKEKRKKILFLNFLGNMYQMGVTLIFGSIGLGILVMTLFPEHVLSYLGIISLSLTMIYVFPFILKKIDWSFKGYSWDRISKFTKKISASIKRRAFLLSTMRYLIFSHQFYLLLVIFKVDASYLIAMALITSMYLLSSLIPMLQLFDVVLRGGVAILLFSFVDANELTILTITMIMWLLNVVLPVIPGSYFVVLYKPITNVKMPYTK